MGKGTEMGRGDPANLLGKVWEERGTVIPAALGCCELTRLAEHNHHVPTCG